MKRTLRAVGVSSLALAVLAVPTAAAPARAQAVVNTAARDAVVASYVAEFARTEPDSGWAGDVTACTPGSTTPAFQASVLQRVNWYRAMAGLTAVAYDPVLVPAAQAAAAYQSNAGRLSHYIEAGTPCYSALASEGSARSNLALGAYGVHAMDLYMVDPGANNTPVGHRWWILSPTLGSIATGDVGSNGTKSAANALYVASTPAAVQTPRDGFVAWPSPGFFPDAVTPARWSFDLPHLWGESYENATVSITGAGGTTNPTVVHRESRLVFEPGVSSSVSADTTWQVTVNGITGAPASSYAYTVTQIDVGTPPEYRYRSSYGASNCADTTSVLARMVFSGNNLRHEFVEGFGDNALFTIDNSGHIRALAELPLDRTRFSVRVRVTNTQGYATEASDTITLKDARDGGVLCPVRNLRADVDGTNVTLRWGLPRAPRGGATYRAYTKHGGYCSSKQTSCTLRGLPKGEHTATVYVEHDGEATADAEVDFRITAGAGKAPRVVAKNTRVRTSTLVKLPGGKLRYRITGGCTLSAYKRFVRTPKRSTSCVLEVQGTTRKDGRNVTVTRRSTFKVR